MITYYNFYAFFCLFYPLIFSAYLGVKRELENEPYEKYLRIFFKRFMIGSFFCGFVTTKLGIEAVRDDYCDYFVENIGWLMFFSFVSVLIAVKNDDTKEIIFFIALCQMANMGAYSMVNGGYTNITFLYEETFLFFIGSNICLMFKNNNKKI